jgi:uncharacterized protein with HEPN domain
MPHDIAHVLHDILETIDRIEEITAGKSLNDFSASWQLRFIVQRAIEIISEASRAIPEELTAQRPEIQWNSLKHIGNVLRHEYHALSDPADCDTGYSPDLG